MNLWTALATGGVAISLIFAVAWVLARIWKNYSLVDAVWAFGIGLTGIFWLMAGGVAAKQVTAAALVGIWSFRLGFHLTRRIRKAHPEEDSRYAELREKWGVGAFFVFFQMQAVSVILLALPFLLIAFDPDTDWSLWETSGTIIILTGIAGEALADRQMNRFKQTNSDPKAVCNEGLWRYSRHPNYFFEAVIWVGFLTYACGSEWGWATVHAPAIIVFLLLKVTGIPPTEAGAVRRKGDAYRRYQRTTSAFIPWPPKREN